MTAYRSASLAPHRATRTRCMASSQSACKRESGRFIEGRAWLLTFCIALRRWRLPMNPLGHMVSEISSTLTRRSLAARVAMPLNPPSMEASQPFLDREGRNLVESNTAAFPFLTIYFRRSKNSQGCF